MSKANELKSQIGDLSNGEFPIDDYGVIAMGLEIDSDMKVLFWSNECGESFFTLTFSDGTQSVHNARGAFLPRDRALRMAAEPRPGN
jgi:hypothetical protein